MWPPTRVTYETVRRMSFISTSTEFHPHEIVLELLNANNRYASWGGKD